MGKIIKLSGENTRSLQKKSESDKMMILGGFVPKKLWSHTIIEEKKRSGK